MGKLQYDLMAESLTSSGVLMSNDSRHGGGGEGDGGGGGGGEVGEGPGLFRLNHPDLYT